MTCLTGHPGATEKQGWVPSQRMTCDAPRRCSVARAVTSTTYVMYYRDLLIRETFKNLPMRKFICSNGMSFGSRVVFGTRLSGRVYHTQNEGIDRGLVAQ